MLIEPGVTVVRLPLESDDELLRNLATLHQLTSGAVLVQSALNPDIYYVAEEAPERLAQDKLLQTVAFCQLLGATTVTIEEIRRTERTSTSTARGSGRRGPLRGSLDREAEDFDGFKREAMLTHRFDGGAPRLDDARQHLLRTGLGRDSHLSGLLDLRAHDNSLIEQHLRVSTRQESKRTRQWLAKVSLPMGNQQLRVDSAIQECADYEFTFSVIFPN